MNTDTKTNSFNVRGRVVSYISLFVGLCLFYPVVSSLSWHGSAQLHTTMESFSTLFALTVGVFALRLYFKNAHYTLLIIGAGFLGTAFLDGYHTIVTSIYVKDLLPSDLPSLIPWSWVASRLYLSVVIFLSWFSWRNRKKIGPAVEIGKNVIFISSGLLTLLCSLFFIFTPLPRAYYPELFFHRPEEFLPALFFALALIGYLRKGLWKSNNFEHWLIITLIINLISQVLFMPLSGTLFDMEFDIAHLLKIVSYVCIFIGLLEHKDHIYNDDVFFNASTSLEKLEIKNNSRFKYSISRSYIALIAILIVFSISLMETIVQNQYTQSLEEKGRDSLDTDTSRVATLFKNSTYQLEHDVLYLSETEAVQGMMRTSELNKNFYFHDVTYQQWRSQLIRLFSQMLQHKKDNDYLRIRFIGIKDYGLELIRVERSNGKIKITPEQELQKKEHWPYMTETLKLKKGEIHYHDITLKREHGKIIKPYVPVLRTATPIYSTSGELFGIIIITKKATSLFNSLIELIPKEHSLYISNANGEFLIHPEANREFGFEFGEQYDVNYEFHGFFENLNITQHQEIVYKDNYKDRKIVAYLKANLDDYSGNFIRIFVAANYKDIVSAADNKNKKFLFLSLLIISFAVVIAWLFSSSITAPLKFI